MLNSQGTARPAGLQRRRVNRGVLGRIMTGRKKEVSEASLPINHDTSILGHELGNVLNGILGMTELLLNSGVSPEQRRWLHSIECCGLQMRQIVEWIESSDDRSESEFLPRHALFNGPAMLEQSLTSHLPEAVKKRNSLVLLIDPDVPHFWHCDPCLLRQLVDNLIGNALKHTVSGEVSLRASYAPGSEAPCGLRIQIADSGSGLDATEMKQIFEAYRQGRSAVEGKGLGLYICKRIVQAMGGQVRCSDTGEQGSCFEVMLPNTLVRTHERSVPGAALLEQVHCRLLLEGNLYRSVCSILTRLGISWSQDGSDRPAEPERGIQVFFRVGKAAGRLSPEALPALCLENRSLSSKSLTLPVFESTLGPVLLEMALEWLSRYGRPGSAPSPCRSKLPGDPG